MNRPILVLVAQLCLAGVIAGQGKIPSPKSQDAKKKAAQAARKAELEAARKKREKAAYEKRQAEIRKRILRQRATIRSQGNILRTHVKVRVNLRNGEKLTGVVRNGLFVEKPRGLEFVRAQMTQKGAGIRIWYYNDADGYIFLPYTMIGTYKVIKRLTEVEIAEIREQILQRERQAKAKGAERKKKLKDKQRELREQGSTTKKLAALAAKLKRNKKREAEAKRLLALVEEFPPKEGWGEEKINQINVRRLTIKVFPNEKERRFIEVFEDWKKGVQMAKDLKKTKVEDDEAMPVDKAKITEPQPGAKPGGAQPKSGTSSTGKSNKYGGASHGSKSQPGRLPPPTGR